MPTLKHVNPLNLLQFTLSPGQKRDMWVGWEAEEKRKGMISENIYFQYWNYLDYSWDAPLFVVVLVSSAAAGVNLFWILIEAFLNINQIQSFSIRDAYFQGRYMNEVETEVYSWSINGHAWKFITCYPSVSSAYFLGELWIKTQQPFHGGDGDMEEKLWMKFNFNMKKSFQFLITKGRRNSYFYHSKLSILCLRDNDVSLLIICLWWGEV